MLDELQVQNIALIEDASLEFAPGMTVLTGETGAGKTALLSALQLMSGGRAHSSAVRDGAGEAQVSARLLLGDDEHVVRRVVSAAGRSRCTIDGQMASVGELAQLSASVRIHGQHDQVALLQPAVQAAYLDTFIDPAHAHVAAYAAAREEYLELAAQLSSFEGDSHARQQELEFLRFCAAEIDKVNPAEGEVEELEAELPRLQHASELAEAVELAARALNADGRALDALAEACVALERQRGIDPALDALTEQLGGIEAELADFTRDLRAYANTVEFDPRAMEDTLERLAKLSGLMKRFGPTMADVFATRERARKAEFATEDGDWELDQLRAKASAAQAAYEAAAGKLQDVRQAAAPQFCQQLQTSVAALAMESACFEFNFTELPFERWTNAGSTRIELLYRPAAAAAPRPMAQIASGGELSRILLALECMHFAAAPTSPTSCTLVFDEIDSGIGGATATAVAERLAQLAENAQVIVVTHLAQVAARAQAHYLVEKQTAPEGELPATTVRSLAPVEREAEIARMLSGAVNATSLAHARQLLEH